MNIKGPIVTLAVGLIVATVLMVMNLSATTRRDLAADGAGPAATTSAAAITPTGTTGDGTAAADATAPVTEKATYAGDVDGSAATIAIAVKDGHAVAYVCDGRRTEAWLKGTAQNGELSLSGAGTAKLTGSYGNVVARGTVRFNGTTWSFSVKQVKPPSGLYRATANVRGAVVTGGWIVEPDGQQTGVLTVAGTPQPAPGIDTTSNSVTIDGTEISAEPVDGSES